MTEKRWNILMKEFGFPENKDTYDSLIKHYSEKHRAYHNLEHISDCLEKLDSIPSPIKGRREIELAIWFHDIIYNPYGKNNELKSANMAVSFLNNQDCSEKVKSNIHDLIMSTLHNKIPKNISEKIIMDIDISILGAEYNVYKEYSEKIRKEYKLVPRILYRKKRKEILSNFLKKNQLYHSDYFQFLEKDARNNITLEIKELS